MDKEKKDLGKKIDLAIALCALGEPCDEAELVRLAIEYARFRCPYLLSYVHMRSLETDAERARALQLEANVNDVIRHTIRRSSQDKWRTMPGMAGLSRLAMERFTDQPKPLARELVRTCECSATRRSPNCKLPPHLCKYTPLMKTVSRGKARSASPRAASPKAASPKAASPKKACSPKTRRSYCNLLGGKRRTRINSKRRRS